MSLTLCTFNANNLYLRYRFFEKYPGDRSKAEPSQGKDKSWGFLPLYTKGMFALFKPEQRDLTATALTDAGNGGPPDLVFLQEVESLLALRAFNEECFQTSYPYALLIDSRDFRQIDVAVLSMKPIVSVRSNIDLRDKEGLVFKRDCLEVTVDLGGGKKMTVFVVHFKSKFTKGKTPAEKAKDKAASDAERKREASAVAEILRARFPGSSFKNNLFAVVGDFNDQPGSKPLQPLLANSLGLENVVERLDTNQRWTHWWKSANEVGQLDYILLSPALAALSRNAKPRIVRGGIGFRSLSKVDGRRLPDKTTLKTRDDSAGVKIPFDVERFPEVTASLVASDHCPLSISFPDL